LARGKHILSVSIFGRRFLPVIQIKSRDCSVRNVYTGYSFFNYGIFDILNPEEKLKYVLEARFWVVLELLLFDK